ncbi:exonuclease domain-containing protein [Rhodoluna limnophila]|uniref:exonuclease domain-containing protein n=1 Tax=Rhodoluna limnophila TaxID=232537 RepID=UPI0011067759|nr:exonuclease domain-containing protein [Rhodoluna limnophila]
MKQIVAIDLETTGFGKSDRIVEIGAVFFDHESGNIIGELETLVNPMRNISDESSRIHGIRAADVSMAPTFEEIAEDFLRLIEGRHVIAHNANFDLRFLTQEFERIGMTLDFQKVSCTMELTGQSLPVACQQIAYEFQHHSALEDARASFALWSVHEGSLDYSELFPSTATHSQSFRTVTRSQVGLLPVDRRVSLLSNLPLQLEQIGSERAYLGLLDAYLRDMQITDLESFGLRDFASSNGIEPLREIELQELYLAEIENAALRDGIITAAEADFFNQIASTLGFERAIQASKSPSKLPAIGSLVCVTGTARVDGVHYDKNAIAAFLESNGFKFTDSISKKANISLLLQESEGSQSSKVAKAQAWGIPRMVLADFIRLVGSK